MFVNTDEIYKRSKHLFNCGLKLKLSFDCILHQRVMTLKVPLSIAPCWHLFSFQNKNLITENLLSLKIMLNYN